MKKPESKLQDLVSRLQAASGDNLVSVVLYGSAAREDFHEQYSDVNVLAIFRDLGAAPLSAITPVIRWWTHEEKYTPPLMMTEVELRESADVFAIELLDIQHMHKTLFGQDVVSAIQIPMNLHRVEVEHELRTALLRLRQHLLLSPDNEDESAARAGQVNRQRNYPAASCPHCSGRTAPARPSESAGAGGSSFRI